MFPRSSVAYLQTGFRTPEIYTVVMVSLLRLDGQASRAHITAFYFVTAVVVLMGTVSWWLVSRSPRARACFAEKDADARAAAQSAARGGGGKSGSGANVPGLFEEDEHASLLTKGSLLNSSSNGMYTSSARANHSSGSSSGGNGSEKLFGGDGGGGDGDEEETHEVVSARIYPCRVAIFLNIWSSIFSAGFFAYVKSAGHIDTELVLYFVRLFSDLVGRPLTRLPRPGWLQTKDQLVRIAGLRLLFMVVFFAYIAFGWQSDAFVIGIIMVFSVLSGYLSVLSYEYAAASVHTKAGQAFSGALMNTTFQVSSEYVLLVARSGRVGYRNFYSIFPVRFLLSSCGVTCRWRASLR